MKLVKFMSLEREIYAVSDVNKEMLEKFASEKNRKNTFTDANKMINDPNIDVIYIATPHISLSVY